MRACVRVPVCVCVGGALQIKIKEAHYVHYNLEIQENTNGKIRTSYDTSESWGDTNGPAGPEHKLGLS